MGTTIDKAFEALYASDDGSLDTAASLLAADRGADAELARRGEEFVRTLWGAAGSPPIWSARPAGTWRRSTYGSSRA